MTLRTLIVLFLAIACGAASAFGVYRFYQATEQTRQVVTAPLETVPVVVATVDIPLVGTSLSREMLNVREWPKGFEPAGSVSDVDEVLGRTLHVPLRKGEAVLVGKFGEGRGMASLVEEGMRAFTIHTPNNTAGVAGFVLPGDFVDVLLTRTGEIETGGSVTTALLQNVKVLASDSMINAPETNSVRGLKSVTLLVSPDEGKRLTLAQSGGTLTLMLRNKRDANLVTSGPITWRDIQYSQGYSDAQASLYAGLGDFFSGIAETGARTMADVAKSGTAAIVAMNEHAKRVEAARVAMEEDVKQDIAAPELAEPKAPLHIQTLRGNSSGLVVIQRP